MRAAEVRHAWLLPCLAALVADASRAEHQDFDVLDGSALFHRELQVRSTAATGEALAAEDAAGPSLQKMNFKDLMYREVLLASEYLETVETHYEEERKEVVQLKKYMMKVQDGLGKPATAVNARRVVDPEDQMMTAKLESMLQDPKVSKALHVAVSEIARHINAFAVRMEKRVADLVVSSANSTEHELPELISKYFQAQEHIMSTLIAKLEVSTMRFMQELPQGYGFIGSFAGQVVHRLGNLSNFHVSTITDQIIASNGTEFCNSLAMKLTEEVLPQVSRTVDQLPSLMRTTNIDVVESKDAVRTATMKVRDAFGSVTSSLTRQARVWNEKICGIITAASA